MIIPDTHHLLSIYHIFIDLSNSVLTELNRMPISILFAYELWIILNVIRCLIFSISCTISNLYALCIVPSISWAILSTVFSGLMLVRDAVALVIGFEQTLLPSTNSMESPEAGLSKSLGLCTQHLGCTKI